MRISYDILINYGKILQLLKETSVLRLSRDFELKSKVKERDCLKKYSFIKCEVKWILEWGLIK